MTIAGRGGLWACINTRSYIVARTAVARFGRLSLEDRDRGRSINATFSPRRNDINSRPKYWRRSVYRGISGTDLRNL